MLKHYKNVELTREEIRAEFEKAGFSAGERVVMKLHFGEPGNKTALDVAAVRPYVEVLKEMGHEVVLWDCPVFYPSQRDTKAGYEKVMKDKGFDKIAECECADDYEIIELGEAGEMDEMTGLPLVAEVAKILREAKNVVVLTHVKGHPCAGFGGAIKNIGIGATSPKTKGMVHGLTNPNGKFGFRVELLGSVVVAAMRGDGAGENGQKVVYVNIIKNVTKYCDCAANPGRIIAPDLGTLVGDDIVEIDQKSLDLVNEAMGEKIFLKENEVDPQEHIDATENALANTK